FPADAPGAGNHWHRGGRWSPGSCARCCRASAWTFHARKRGATIAVLRPGFTARPNAPQSVDQGNTLPMKLIGRLLFALRLWRRRLVGWVRGGWYRLVRRPLGYLFWTFWCRLDWL